MAEDVRTQCVLKLGQETCDSHLAYRLDVRQFGLDVMEDAKNLSVDGTEDVGDICWGAYREAKDSHAVDRLGA